MKGKKVGTALSSVIYTEENKESEDFRLSGGKDSSPGQNYTTQPR
jgi:hypothetical protein